MFLLACAADPGPAGPPHVGTGEQLSSGKADGGPALGTPKISGEQSGYRTDSTPFTCYPGGTVAFDVKYENKSLPWGVKVYLWRGMSGEEWCGGCEQPYDYFYDWMYQRVDEMTATAPYVWAVHTDNNGYGSGAGGRFISTKVVFKIDMPDGTTKWDNGGSAWGYYEAQVPDPACDASWKPWETNDSPMAPLPFTTVPRW